MLVGLDRLEGERGCAADDLRLACLAYDEDGEANVPEGGEAGEVDKGVEDPPGAGYDWVVYLKG